MIAAAARQPQLADPDRGCAARDVALVHDYLLTLRGAERTFLALSGLWPDAPVYTLLYDEDGTAGAFTGRRIRTSPLQRLGVRQSGFRRLLPLYPAAVQRMALDEHDVVISSSSAFAHGVHTRPDAVHICYCHSPFRYAWHERSLALTEVPAPARPALGYVLKRHRAFDRRAIDRVTHLVANSELTRDRIRRFWGRDADVVYPPVDIDRYFVGERTEDYVLFVGEMVSHKRVDLALEATRLAGQRLVLVGGGPQLERLKARYGSHAEFLGRVSDDRLTELYASARAVVIPNVEEFGITAVEAQASGRPVVAAEGGGARETVIDGCTGWLVPPGDVRAMASALNRTDELLAPRVIQRHAREFSTQRFQQRFGEIVDRYVGASARRASA